MKCNQETSLLALRQRRDRKIAEGKNCIRKGIWIKCWGWRKYIMKQHKKQKKPQISGGFQFPHRTLKKYFEAPSPFTVVSFYRNSLLKEWCIQACALWGYHSHLPENMLDLENPVCTYWPLVTINSVLQGLYPKGMCPYVGMYDTLLLQGLPLFTW